MTVRKIPLLPVMALTAALAPGALVGQERPLDREPQAQDTVPQDTTRQDTVLVRATPISLGYDPAAFSLELSFGLPGSGDAQRQPVQAWRTTVAGAVIDSALVTRTLRVRGGVFGGLSGILGLDRDWALQLGVAYATAAVESRYTGAETDSVMVRSANAAPGTAADLRVLSLEMGVRYRIPSSKRFRPYLELGTAMSRWTTQGSVPPALADAFGTRFEAVAGVGGLIPLTSRFSARIHASTRVSRTLMDPRAAGDTLAVHHSLGWPPTREEENRTTVLVSRAPARTLFADAAREVLDLIRLQVGLSYDLGRPARPAEPPEAPPAPADTTLPPGR